MIKLTPAPAWITHRPIAHRGYHDLKAGRAENSLSAALAAKQAGFAIECDLQVSSTGEPVVFHDPDLDRMTAVSGKVREKSPAELAEIQLSDTGDTIQTLAEHFKCVDGSVPMILELKGVEGQDGGFVEGVAEAVSSYRGLVAVMSFDHHLCAQFKHLMPEIPRGLTAQGGDEAGKRHTDAMQAYDLQFVSYRVREVDNPFVHDMRRLGLPVITWTVRTRQEQKLSHEHADQMTFEGFDPRESSHDSR